jgi:energy-coupling factor transporter ATP-binding protein EcfA2
MSASTDPDVFNVTLPVRPYPGLRPFGKDEWPIFFGRERMLDDVVERLMKTRMLVVHGASGCGKSSLIRAGVLPRLEQESARGGGRWVTHITTPGNEPLANLSRVLAGEGGETQALNLRRILNCGADGAERLVAEVCDRESLYVCVLIDQFEEIFAQAPRQQAALLIDQLLGLERLHSDRLFVVLTMRSDFLGACAQFDGFAAAVNRTQYLLPRMEHRDLVRAIREPAILYDGEIALDLAERLIAEARGSQDELPLIQHGLMQLYDHHVPAGAASWRLALEHYRYPGGLGGLLSAHADAVMTQVEPAAGDRDGPRVTEDLFRALTDVNADNRAIRNPQRLRDLVAVTGADEEAVRRILDAFRAEGVSFIRPYATDAVPPRPIGPDEYVDISHEALIRCWTRLADENDGWLSREFKNGLIWRSLLVQAESFERDPSNVLSAATAEERSIWLKRRNPNWAKRYGGGWPRVVALVERSMAERKRQLDEEVEARAREEQVKLREEQARAREEQAKLREEQARLEERTLKSELATAVEKNRRIKLFRWGMVVALVLFGLAATAAWRAWQESSRANQAAEDAKKAQSLAEDAARAARERRDAAERRAEQATEAIKGIQEEVVKLQTAASAAPANSALRQTITDAGNSIAKGANSLLSPRLYITFNDESQRAPAQALARRLSGARLGDYTLLVPSVEARTYRGPGLLRCFVAEECRQYGQQLLALVNRELSAPKLRLQDFSGTYTPDGTIRPLHFEIYFPPSPLVLEQVDSKMAY